MMLSFCSTGVFALMIMISSLFVPVPEDGSIDRDWNIGDRSLLEMGSGGHFTENGGQWDDSVLFVGTTSYGRIGLGSSAVYHEIRTITPSLHDGGGDDLPDVAGYLLRLDLLNANDVTPTGNDLLPHPTSYFMGNDPEEWVSGARSFETVEYEGIWDGIDLIYTISEKGPKYTYVVSPEGSIDDIRIMAEGQKEMKVWTGCIEFTMNDGMTFTDSGLAAYYEDDGAVVPSRFTDLGNGIFGFEVKDRDPTRTVVIDPLVRSTLLGGNGGDVADRIAVDENGDYYIAGVTTSTNFPTTPGAIKTAFSGQWRDCFLTKMNRTLGTIEYSTLFGGNHAEGVGGLKVHNGEAIVSGYTQSPDFQTTPGCYQNESEGGWRDAWLLKMNRSGTGLIFSTYISGSGDEFAYDVEVDGNGNIILVGNTDSTDFPITSDAYSSTRNASTDSFILKMLPNGTDLVYSSFIGGNGYDALAGLRFSDDGDLLIFGTTSSTDFYTSAGAYDTVMSGLNDMVLMIMDSNLSLIRHSTLFGSSGFDGMNEAEIAADGDIVLIGYGTGFPATEGAYDTTANGENDIVAARFDPTLSTLVYCTLIGGSDDERTASLELDSNDNLFIAGQTQSTDFPTTKGAYDETYNGSNNVNTFVSKLDGTGSALIYSTFIGGSGSEFNSGLVLIDGYDSVIAGRTSSPDYPVTSGAYDTTPNTGSTDLYITELSLLSPPMRPINLTGVKGFDWMYLAWEVPADDGGRPILGYEVYGTARGGIPEIVATLPPGTLSHNITGLKPDGSYLFHVRARNSIGLSGVSNGVRFADVLPPWTGLDLTVTDNAPLGSSTFSVQAFDDTFVDHVCVEFSMGDHLGTMNATMDMDAPGVYSYSVEHPDEVFTMEYRFTLNDTSGNWFVGERRSFNVSGEIRPSFGNDLTPLHVRSGEELRFGIEVEDNDALKEVRIEYWSHIHQKQNMTMTMTGNGLYEYSFITDRYSLRPVNYVFHAVDMSGHWNSTGLKTVSILDVDGPLITHDSTPKEAAAGHQLTFDVWITDNQRIADAWVLYSVNGGDIMNGTLERAQGSGYRYRIDIPPVLGRLRYSFHALDRNNNTGRFPETEIPILDVDPPEIIGDDTDRYAGSGREIMFSFTLKDNVGISSAVVEYWFDREIHRMLELDEDEEFTGVMSIPSGENGMLSYFVKVTDSGGNRAESDVVDIDILDGEAPVILRDLTTRNVGTGDTVEFAVRATDNIGVRKVRVEYGREGSPDNSLILENNNGVFSSSITVPEDDDSDMEYRFILIDHEGNAAVSELRSISVSDDAAPVVIQVDDLSVSTRTRINVIVDASDNIGLESISWSGAPMDPVGNSLKGVIEEPGTYLITVRAVDVNGNSASMSFMIYVENPEGIGQDDDGGIPVWMFIPPVIAVLLMIGSILHLFVGGRRKKNDALPITDPPVQGYPEGSDLANPMNPGEDGTGELDDLFRSIPKG